MANSFDCRCRQRCDW